MRKEGRQLDEGEEIKYICRNIRKGGLEGGERKGSGKWISG